MSEDSAWAAGDDQGDVGGADLGRPVDEGYCAPSIVFNPVTFFTQGINVFTGAPVLVLLAGVNLWLISFVIPQLLNLLLATPVSLMMTAMAEMGSIDPILAQVVSQFASIGVTVAVFPVQLLITAGAIVGIGHWIKTGEVNIVLLYTSFRQGVNAFLFGLLSVVITLPLVLIASSPLILVAGLLGAGIVSEDILLPALALAFLATLMLGLAALVLVLFRIVLGQYAAVLDDRGPVDALSATWSRVDTVSGLLIAFNTIVITIVTLPLACTCIGQIPVLGFQLAAMTIAWLCVSRDRDELAAWHFFKDHEVPQ